ncbi:hypothetical protein GUJ93_ZPchr0010g9696 [Zizania palustris]|uniref:Sphingomyelin synthase-like domain-containing protein n=1 Tax=Zizania palustris TaxID=103762 RepID=A0A8J5WAP2_ZIZPA|nr:hypothetical protein GUJ93_ZPchr0010g9696 [Zizania palustris]
MATEWSDGGEEFSLPDEFLDDDFFSEEEKAAVAARSESDEEDCLAGVTRSLAVLLGDDGERAPPSKAEVTVGSPQSTLCGLPKSGQETPNGGASQGNSPPSSPLEQNPADPWDLLFEAASEVARTRVNNKIPEPSNRYGFHGHGGFAAPARKPSSPPPVAPPVAKVPAGRYYHPLSQLITQRQIHAAQFHLLKQQQLLKQQRDRHLAAAAACGARQTAAANVVGCNLAWPPLQRPQHAPAAPLAATGMRAVFLTPPGAKLERNGTGVFLPRPAGAPAEPRKKTVCSTVLVPARVVQALNLNLDDLGAQPRYPGGIVLDHVLHCLTSWNLRVSVTSENLTASALRRGALSEKTTRLRRSRLGWLASSHDPALVWRKVTTETMVELALLREKWGLLFAGIVFQWTFHPFIYHSKRFYTVLIWRRVLAFLVASQVLRIITFYSTLLPGPNYHCREGSKLATLPPPNNVLEVLLINFPRGILFGCGDLIFSSHMIFTLVFVRTYHKYGSKRLIKLLAWFMAIIQSLLIIASRKHYSVDVVVAWYTVNLVVFFVDSKFAEMPDRTNGLPSLPLSSREKDVRLKEEKDTRLKEEFHKLLNGNHGDPTDRRQRAQMNGRHDEDINTLSDAAASANGGGT